MSLARNPRQYTGVRPINPPNVIYADRAPITSDTAYVKGDFWLDQTNVKSYQYYGGGVWLDFTGGPGSFTTLTNTLAYTLGTAQAANNSTIGSGQTTGTIILGGSAAQGAITLGSSSATQILNLATGTGAATVNLATGVTNAKTINIGTGAAMANGINIGGTGANVIAIGNTQTGGSITLGAAQTTGTISIGGTGLHVGTISIAPGTGAQIVNIATNTGYKTLNIGSSSSVLSAVTITAGTNGGILLSSNNISITNTLGSAASNNITINARVFQATLSGQTTASGSTLVCTITNSYISANNSSLFITVCNLGTNDAQMTIQRIVPAAGSVAITLKNNGAAALNGDIHINGWAVNL